eukprot:c11556_g1_i2.p1 GENE.c11556_g1_i2~~c11556_g1_i2.p1  ORF type:complete len:321 (+),score=99.06 c11556_g1_i2:45-965(+)
MDANRWLESAKAGKILDEGSLFQLCEKVKEILLEEPNVVQVEAPVTVVGDVHGQFHDVLEMFNTVGWAPDRPFVFLGDYVDRGANSLETLVLLLCLKLHFPSKITLLRGNHECRQITTVYGFYEETLKKYGTAKPWHLCCELFDYLPLAAMIGETVLCVHGGLSPDISCIDQINTIARCQELPNQGKFCDLMWSDPSEDIATWLLNERGAGYLFGHKVAAQFNHVNGLSVICRAHQLAMEGFQYHFESAGKSVVTVWSAPNYCYRCGNKATVMAFDSNLTSTFIEFNEASSMHNVSVDNKPDLYFL